VLKAFEKILNPWIELFEDSVACIRPILLRSAQLYKTYIWSTPKSIEWLVDIASLKICEHPLTRGLRELIEDGGSYYIPLISLVVMCGPTAAGSSLVLAKASFAKKVLLAFFGGIFIVGANILNCRAKSSRSLPLTRDAYKRGVYALTISSFAFLGVAGGDQLGAVLQLHGFGEQVALFTSYVSHPTLFFLFCKELLVYPLMLINIQYLAAASNTQVFAPILLSTVGSSLAASSFTTLVPVESQLFIDYGALSCMVFATSFMQNFETGCAVRNNQLRAGYAGYATVLWWAPSIVVLLARVAGFTQLEGLEPGVAFLDLFGIGGICHITLKHRDRLNDSARFYADEEPTSETGAGLGSQ
jgi:hypothetical protein